MPIFKLSPNILAILPANVGPPAQPTSPANARNANIAVPPPFIEVDASLYVPGQSMPTENPDTAIPIKPTIADDENVSMFEWLSYGELPVDTSRPDPVDNNLTIGAEAAGNAKSSTKLSGIFLYSILQLKYLLVLTGITSRRFCG